MKKSLSMHPLVKGISPSQWAKLSDARRMYENNKAVRETKQLLEKGQSNERQ